MLSYNQEELPLYLLIDALNSEELNMPDVATVVKTKLETVEKDNHTKAVGEALYTYSMITIAETQ